tara:strand:- start:1905 stop:2054 length:150 start_codon:yes stop_codon:yes gene_type:complete
LEQHADDRLAAVPSTGALIAKGKEQRDQLNAIRETLEQLEGGTPNVIDV